MICRTERDVPVEKLYYTTGETARILGIDNSNVRYWLQQFNLSHKVSRSSRAIPKLTVAMLIEVKRLLEVELYTIAGARRQLQLNPPKLLPYGTNVNTTESPTILGELRDGHGAEAPAEDGAPRNSENKGGGSQGGSVLRKQPTLGDNSRNSGERLEGMG